jgi:hypothetical protein
MTDLIYIDDFDIESREAVVKSVTQTEDNRTDIRAALCVLRDSWLLVITILFIIYNGQVV